MVETTEMKIRREFPDLEFLKILSVADAPHFNYNGFVPGQTTIQKDHVKSPGKRPFPSDVIYERDAAVPMRDNVKLYTDIFRPPSSDSTKVPALMVWSPYGKTGTGVYQYDKTGPFRCGVLEDATSGYEKFEGPDPADWCGRGYAIVNIDARGAGMSEGYTHFWGIQEAEDIYDTIDWLSRQPWCNGSVAMMGNSWLAIAQINFASRLTHPALKALAPMEGLSDPYREFAARGGMPHNASFLKVLTSGFVGPMGVEDLPGMLAKRPLYDEYWASKYIDTANIDVPLYLTASYSSGLHVGGSFGAFRKAKTKQKWLRVHSYQEWHDLYRPMVTNELQQFFDRFCKGIDNGWERDTPPVRLSLIGFDGSPAKTITERPEMEYPLARQQLETFHLDASSHTLVREPSMQVSTTSHDAHSLTASSDFSLRFNMYTEVAGYAKAILWVSCAEHDDMDVTVQLRKADASGKLLEHVNYPCPVPSSEVPNTNVAKFIGTEGFLRASHAVSRDDSRAPADGAGQEVFYTHARREPVPKGTVTKLEITLWPTGMVFEKGEMLVLRVSGREMLYPEFEAIAAKEPQDENVGVHVLHTGGEYDSRVIIPVI